MDAHTSSPVPEITVILPTLNEAESIGTALATIEQVFSENQIDGEILVVDDRSQDATIAIVREYQKTHPNVQYLVRTTEPGLSRSLLDGFTHARADRILVTDADLQHDVTLIPQFLDALRDHDLVIGSRYMRGGSIEHWAWRRRIISLGATGLGQTLFPGITDPVSGFFALHRSVVEGVTIRGRGYKLSLDILAKGKYRSVTEIPYRFMSRKQGASKLNLSTIREYALQVGELVLYTLNNPTSRVWDEWRRIGRFGVVGATGVGVNWGMYALLAHGLVLAPLGAAVIAIETSIISNFLLNDRWTFQKTDRSIARFLAFQSVSMVGMVVQLAVFSLLVACAGSDNDLLVYPVGILVAFAWNYWGNRRLTWKNLS
ncbi:MAG: glycosyltransferase family 2 protein [candidate division Zixibacteria bacterium]|jgi:dolichol-phosphate mannosyltransferase|nr:glycosyltransferase family 2 protein [candidate division Zixibacteria bacterium]